MKPLVKKLLNILSATGKRCVIFYIIIFLLLIFLVDFDKAMRTSRLRTLNRLMPSLTYLIKLEENSEKINKKELTKAVYYYEKINEYIPTLKFDALLADSTAMLGYCYYHLGRQEEAISAYKKAIELNPSFIWFYHNLGIIYFKSRRYEDAADMFGKAVKTNPTVNAKIIVSSKIFNQIYVSCKENGISLEERQKTGYRDSYTLLVLSNYHLTHLEEMFKNAAGAIQRNLDTDGFFYYYAGLAALKLKNLKQAAFFINESIKRNPENADAYHFYASILMASGQKKSALKFRQKAKILHKISPLPIDISTANKISLKVF